MATSSAVTGTNPLHCLLCWNIYNIPRSLPCKHTFCEECLSSYIESSGIQESDSDKYFECPACRFFVKVPDTNASATDISKSFQLNALYKSVSRSHNTAGTHCDVCLGDNETETANAWCIECGEALCTDCRVAHKKVRHTKKHQVVDLEDAFQNVLAYSRSNEECPKHPETMLELFCLNHKELCCTLCVPTFHNSCKKIRSLDDIAKRVEKHRDRTSFIQEFMNMKTEVMSISQQEDLHNAEVDKEYTDTLSVMDNLITETKNKLDELYGCFKSKVNAQKNSRKRILLRVQNQTRMLQINLENCVGIMTAITERASPRHVFVIQEQLKSQITSHVHEAKTVIKDFKETQVKLETEDAILKIANSILSVGHITETETPSAPVQNALARIEENINILRQTPDVSLLEDSVSSSDMLESLIISRPLGDVDGFDSMTVTTRKVKSVANSGLGRYTWFTGGTYLPDGRLLLADNSNGEIMMYDNKYNLINKHKLKAYPSDIAYSDKHKVVLVRTTTDIQQYAINGDDLKYVSTSPLPRQSSSSYRCGIAVYDDTILLGTDNFVHMLEMDGTEQKHIPRNGKCSYVAVCSELGRFCYSHKNKVVSCKMDGTEIFRYYNGNLGDILGVSFDRSGSIYVCCDGPSYTVHQISRDGQRGRDLLLDQSNISKPFYVMYHPSDDILLVTEKPRLMKKMRCEVFELGDFTK